MKSKTILPLAKRETASAKDLLKALEACELELDTLLASPLLPAYRAITCKINEWSEQLETTKIDILDDERDDTFLRSHKFFIELSLYVDSRRKLLEQMNPEEKELAGDYVTRNVIDPRKK
jgi:hypothetical protein